MSWPEGPIGLPEAFKEENLLDEGPSAKSPIISKHGLDTIREVSCKSSDANELQISGTSSSGRVFNTKEAEGLDLDRNPETSRTGMRDRVKQLQTGQDPKQVSEFELKSVIKALFKTTVYKKMTICRLLLIVANTINLILAIMVGSTGIQFINGDFFRSEDEQKLENIKNDENLDGEVLTSIPWGVAFILLAIVFGQVTVLGFTGVFTSSRSLLKLYSNINAGFIVLGYFILVFLRSIIDIGKETLLQSLRYYEGSDGNNSISRFWNKLMIEGQCCGVYNYLDFQRAKLWRTDTADNETLSLVTPLVCCRNETLKNTNVECAQRGTANDEVNYMSIGCYHKFALDYFANSTVFATAGLLLLDLIFICVCSRYLAHNVARGDQDKMSALFYRVHLPKFRQMDLTRYKNRRTPADM